jgi:predicted nucleic acid-binding protein
MTAEYFLDTNVLVHPPIGHKSERADYGAIIAAAERLGVKTVYSEDLNHRRAYGSVVLNPFRTH